MKLEVSGNPQMLIRNRGMQNCTVNPQTPPSVRFDKKNHIFGTVAFAGLLDHKFHQELIIRVDIRL